MKIETIKKKGFAISLITFPLMLLLGFMMHPRTCNQQMASDLHRRRVAAFEQPGY